jgi:hypothetical protein
LNNLKILDVSKNPIKAMPSKVQELIEHIK